MIDIKSEQRDRDKAKASGYQAYLSGLPHHENPFRCWRNIHWSIGWIRAKQETTRKHHVRNVNH